MEPLPYGETKRESMERLFSVVEGMKGAKVVQRTATYIHVEFTSALLRFVDDVEFLFDDASRVIHFRSASRLGCYDFGVNRKRMQFISDKYLH